MLKMTPEKADEYTKKRRRLSLEQDLASLKSQLAAAIERAERVAGLLREARTWVERGADYNGSRSEIDSAELCNRIDAALKEQGGQ